MKTYFYTLSILFLLTTLSYAQKLPKNYGKVETTLFLGDAKNELLLVVFGGSEGGNTFATESTQEVRESFHKRGFHFLAVNYFGSKGLPKDIDRISLTAIKDSIENRCKQLEILLDNVVLMGASRGGELALNLASYYDFRSVIALVASNVTIPNFNNKVPTSSWTLNDEEIPFLSLNKKVIKKEGWHSTLEASLANQQHKDIGLIPIENSKGFVFLTSGKSDELWPSYTMSNKIISRLEKYNFSYPFAHKPFEGGHDSSTHWSKIFSFIDNVINYKK